MGALCLNRVHRGFVQVWCRFGSKRVGSAGVFVNLNMFQWYLFVLLLLKEGTPPIRPRF